MIDLPLISVGIPTFNRGASLKKMLPFIINQTYSNLEIIVSDNSTPGTEVEDIMNSFCLADNRIQFWRQKSNIGALSNFKFVLSKAQGTFFMWAADDDEWTPDFIEHMLSIIGKCSAAFCNFSIKYHGTQRLDKMNIQHCAMGSNKYEQSRNFLIERYPSLFYSLYRTDDIRWFLSFKHTFDWMDCYVILRTILLGNGYVISKENLYQVGINTPSYEFKPMNPRKGRVFTYFPYFKNSCNIISISNLSLPQKMKLIYYIFDVNVKSFMALEKCRRNFGVFMVLYKIYVRLTPSVRYIKLY